MPKKTNPETLFVVGRNPVREALEREPDRIEKVMIQRGGGRGLEGFRRVASSVGVPVQYVPLRRMNQLAGPHHQGVMAISTPIAYRDVDALLTAIAPTLEEVQHKKPVLLMLDGVEDPHNLGAILRTAVAAGVEGVIVPKKNIAPINATVVKASAGMAMRIPIARVDNLARMIEQLKERGYWVMGGSGIGDVSVWTVDWNRPIVLVMGSEGKGLHARVASACDYLISIPMRGDAESLNVSVAAGVLLFAAARMRQD